VLTKYQATVVGDQLIADARRHGDDEKTRRLVAKAGPKPGSLTLEQFEIAVHNAEKLASRSWILWSAVAAWSFLMLALLYVALSHFKTNPGGVVVGMVPLGFLLTRWIRRWLVGRYVRSQIDVGA
jgi:hypothetical protein